MISLLAARAFAATWWKAGAGAIVGAALALPVGQCQGAAGERDRQAAAAAEASLLQVTKNAAAAETAAAKRLTDTAVVATDQRNRDHVIEAAPAGRAAPSSVALACERLCQQGVRTDARPAICRPFRACEAPARP